MLGSNGEGVHLNEAETDAVLEPRARAFPGTQDDRRHRTSLHPRDRGLVPSRGQVGADAVLVLPPSYYRGQMTRAVLVDHFQAVADAAHDARGGLQHAGLHGPGSRR